MEFHKSKPDISVIIPLFVCKNNKYIVDRILNCKSDKASRLNIEYIIVDFTHDKEISKEIKDICLSNGIELLNSISCRDQCDFSLAKARNIGAIHASSEKLLFLDVDLIPYNGFYRDVFNFKNRLFDKYYVDFFFWIPVVYDKGYEFDSYYKNYLTSGIEKIDLINRIILNKNIDSVSSGTSALCIDKLFYCQLGGQNEEFLGWGYEDYEFQIRCIIENMIFPKPKAFGSSKGNFSNITKYEGWRSIYMLYGEIARMQGIFLLHQPHSELKQYKSRNSSLKNRFIFEKTLKSLVSGVDGPRLAPLRMADGENALIMQNTPYTNLLEVSPCVAQHTFLHDINISDLDQAIEYVNEHNISIIIFGYPFVNDIEFDLYNWCKHHGFPLIVCGHGIFPNSVYFDETGILPDSEKQKKEFWNTSIGKEEIEKSREYIESLRNTNRNKLIHPKTFIKNNRKNSLTRRLIVIMPDKSHKYMLKRILNINNDDEILNRIYKITDILKDSGWIITFINSIDMDISGNHEKYNRHDIHDLLDVAESVLSFTPHDCMLAAAYGVPSYVDNRAFHALDGLIEHIDLDNPENSAYIINEGFSHNSELLEKYIYYLISRYYSIIDMETNKRYEKFKSDEYIHNDRIRFMELSHPLLGGRIYYMNGRIDIDISNIDRCLNKYIVSRAPLFNRFVNSKKLTKLMRNPVLYFLDAIRNIFNSKGF